MVTSKEILRAKYRVTKSDAKRSRESCRRKIDKNASLILLLKTGARGFLIEKF